MTDHVWGTQTNTTTGATTNLSLGEWGDIGRFAGQRTTQAAIDAGIRAAMEGGSFQGHLGDSVENAVAHVVSGVLFNAVGDLAGIKDWAEGSPEKIALHALVGGSVAEAMGGDFRTGALAAGANEALIEHLADLVANDSTWLVAASQVVGIVAAELAGGDVAIGAEVAGQATRYNYLSHQQLTTANEELAACDGDSACMAEVVDRYQALSQQQDDAGYAACVDDLAACQQHSLAANGGVYAAYSDGSLWDLSPEALPYMQALFDQNIGVQNSFSEATIARLLAEGTEISPEVAAVLAAMPVGYNRKTDPYHPQASRQQLEAEYGIDRVTSTTVPPGGGRNVGLAGQRHPVTGVVFDQRGYPIFDNISQYDTRIPVDQFNSTDYQGQMRMATRDLRNQLDSNPLLRSQFTSEQLQAIQSGRANIPDYTWHHHQDVGRMQLVPRMTHRQTGHIGGESMSGGR